MKAEIPKCALVVEDNLIIALDAEDQLDALGAGSVMLAESVADALVMIDQNKFDFALLDVTLEDGSCEPVAHRLLEMDIPFVFATGHDKLEEFERLFPKAPFVQKPYSQETLCRAIEQSLE